MTKLAASASNLNQIKGEQSASQIITQGLLSISYNQEAKKTFTQALSSLVLGRPLHEPTVAPEDFMLVVSFAAGMKRFVYAHEYAHIILKHVSSSEFIPVGVAGDSEHAVLRRDWRQEIQADELGYKLVLHALAGDERQDPNKKNRELYEFASMAPLFFLDCLELLDRAKMTYQRGELQRESSETEKAVLRSCAEQVLANSETPECAVLVRDTHPPAWLTGKYWRVLCIKKCATTTI